MSQVLQKIRKLRKEFKRMVEDRVEAVREYLSSRRNRIVLGILFTGIGIALIISRYIPMPE